MPETVTYRTSKGVYDIPKDKEKSFKDANPDAEIVVSFVVGKDTFDIPSSKVDAFLKAKPKAVPLKKNKSTEVSSKDSSPVSQDKEPTSTSLLDKVVGDGVKGDVVSLQEEAGIKTQPYKSPVAEKSEIESVIGEGVEKQLDERGEMRPEIKKELEKIPTFTELSDSETKKIAASYASTVDDKKTYSLIKDAVTRVEIDYARSGILTPGKKILAYSEATEPITAEYLSLLRGGYPTEEQRNAYVSKLKEVAKGLGADLNENYELVVDDEIYDRKVSENIGKMYGSVQQDTPYFQYLTNTLSSGMSAASAAAYSTLGKLLALNTIPGYSDVAEEQRIMSQIAAERVDRDISVTAALANGNIGEAVGNAMLGFAQSLPQMLLAASTGNPYAAAAVFSALSYSEKYDELAGSDMSAAGRFGYSLAWGLADGLPQAFGSFKVMSKSMNTLANGIGRESAESVIKGGLMGQFEKYSSQLLGGTLTAARGGAEEMTTLYLQDLLVGKLSSQDAYADAFLIGAFSDIAMSSPTILAQTKESARDLSLIALSKLPKKMPIESKVNAGKILMEKEVVEKEPELDESFKGGTSDKKQTLNDALKVTDQPQTVKEKINELNKGIKEELEKEYPNTAVLAEMENELEGIEKSISIVGGGNLKVVNDKITSLRKERDGLYKDVKSEVELQDKAKEEKRINAELKDALVEKQKIRNEIYDRSLAGIDHPLNAAANETARTKAKESVENIKQKAVVSEEKAKVAQEPAKEEKVAETRPIEPKMDIVEPKIEKDEKVVQEQAEVDEGVGKESIEAPESIETGKDSQEVVFKEVGGVVVLESSNPYLRADVDERTGELVQGITKEQWNDPTFLQEKAKDLKKEIAYSKKAKMDVAVETEALGVVEGRMSDINPYKKAEYIFKNRESFLTLQKKEDGKLDKENKGRDSILEMGGSKLQGEVVSEGFGEQPRYDVGGSGRVIGNSSIKEHSLNDEEAAGLKSGNENNVIDNSFSEISDSKLFHKSISDSKKDNKYAASVFVYPEKEYKISKKFITKDGLAGAAIDKNGTIISVFSHGKGKGRAAQIVFKAIKEGGMKLDHYDTKLSQYYYDFGFVPVARVKWNDKYAPKDWDKEKFKRWNNGEPDVVLMVYQGGDVNTLHQRYGKFGKIDLSDVPYFNSFESAQDFQQQYVNKVKQDAKEQQSGEMRVEAEKVEGESVGNKDMPKIDKPVVQDGKEIETKIKELSTVEKLEAKKKAALQSASERAARLGNISFALDEGGKKQAISDIAGLIKDLSEAGIISLEIGAVKALDAVTAYLSLRNPKVNDFVKENRKEILSEFDKIVNTVIEENKKKPDAEREIINEDFFNLFPVGVTNYYTEASRQAREKSPILKKAFEADKVFWDNILGKIESGEVNPRLIVQDIYNEQGDVAVTTERQAYILYDRVRISKERKLVQDDLDKAVESGDTNTEATLIQRLGELEIENDINDIANTKIGSEWGRFGQFRQMVVDDDYSLKSVLKDAKILNNNVTLTFQQEAKFKELTDKYNALKEEKERLESEAEKRREEFEKQDGVEFVENVKKKVVSKHKSNIKLKGKELADKIRSGKLKNKQFNFSTVVPPQIIDGAIEVVAKSIEVGSSLAQAIKQGLEYIKKTDWYKKLTSNEKTSFDEKFGIYAIRLTVDKEVNNKEYDELIENFIELSEGSINSGLNSILGDIAYNRVLAGLDTIEEIVDSIYGDIKDSIPGVTKREIRDAISGYGKFRKLSKYEVDVVLREIKRQGRLDSALEDVDKGKLPLRSGTQRDRKTEKTRRKERDIARKIKDGNLVPEPTKEELDEAWRSSEQAYIQKLENAIDDVKKELASGIKRDKAKPKEYTSPDVIRLKKELEILNEIKREKFGEPKQTPEQKREKAVINSIQRAIDRLNLDILDAIKGITPADRDLAIRSVGGDKMFGFKDKQKGSLSSKEIDKMKNLRDGLRRQLSDLMPEAIKEKALLEKYKKSRHTTLKRLQDQKAKGDYGVKPKAGVKPEDAEIVAINREIHKIKEEIEEEKERVRLAARSGMEVLAETSLDIWNLSKVMMASVDLSAPFRQGIVMIGKPKSFAKAFADMFRHALSKEYHENWLRDLKSGDMYYEMKNFGLYISEPTAKLSANEEQFMSRFIKSLGKIPVYGLALTGSERAYSGFLNKLRTDVYTNFRRQLELEGVSGQEFENEMKSYAHFINTATGRGKLGHLEPIAPILNGAFFAPRLISSRLNLALNPFFYTKMESRARKDALKTVGGFIGVVVTTLILFDIMGGDDDDDYNVEWNANSSDFLKIRKGNKRYDITGGFSQPIRTISQVFSGKVKSTKDGGFSYLSKDDFPYKTRLDVLSNFLLYKLSPSMSLVYGMLNDFESVIGEPMTVGGVLWEKALPLYVQDMIEIIEEEGAGRAVFSSIPAIFGVGVQYYGTESQILKGDILDTKRKIKRTNRDIEVLEDRVYGGDFEKSDDLRKKRKKSIELERELMMLEAK